MLRFARDLSVPATNNLAERLLRLYKIQRKISGCSRSVAGAVAQANLGTMLETTEDWLPHRIKLKAAAGFPRFTQIVAEVSN